MSNFNYFFSVCKYLFLSVYIAKALKILNLNLTGLFVKRRRGMKGRIDIMHRVIFDFEASVID